MTPDPLPTDPTAAKPVWESKSFWLGVVLTLVGVSTYFADPLHTPTMTVASISEAVGGVAAIVLRVWFTASPIEHTGLATKVEVAKQNIALNAAHDVMATQPVQTIPPPAVPPTLDALPALLAELKQRHNKDGALLAEIAGAAGTQPSMGPAGMPPVGTTP